VADESEAIFQEKRTDIGQARDGGDQGRGEG